MPPAAVVLTGVLGASGTVVLPCACALAAASSRAAATASTAFWQRIFIVSVVGAACDVPDVGTAVNTAAAALSCSRERLCGFLPCTGGACGCRGCGLRGLQRSERSLLSLSPAIRTPCGARDLGDPAQFCHVDRIWRWNHPSIPSRGICASFTSFYETFAVHRESNGPGPWHSAGPSESRDALAR